MINNNLKSLSIIIPNYNGSDLIKNFLEHNLKIISSYKGKKEVLFIDDASRDDSIKETEKFLKDYNFLKIFINESNKGFSKTCNIGANKSSMEILFFLNNDVLLGENYFDSFNNYFKENDTFALASCGYDYNSKKQLDGIKLLLWKRGFFSFTQNIYNEKIKNKEQLLLSFGFQGAYFFVDKKKFKELNGFDEIYSPYILEETDLAYRALKRRWKIFYDPNLKAFHKKSSTIKSNTKKVKIISYRNKLIFTWKNLNSSSLIISHIFFLSIKLLSLNPIIWISFIKALDKIKIIINERKKNKNLISDKILLFNSKKYYNEIIK